MALEHFRKHIIDYKAVYESRNLEKTDFGLLNNYIFFIDKANANRSCYIESNLEEITSRFAKWGRKFVYLPNLEKLDFKSLETLKYQSPNLLKPKETFTDLKKPEDILLEYFNYKGDIECGLLETNYNFSEIAFYEILINFDMLIEMLISDLIDHICSRKIDSSYRCSQDDDGLFLYAPVDMEFFDENLEIEEEIEKEIKEIVNQLESIKKKGLLVTALPVLEKMATAYSKKLDDKPSILRIDGNFRILLKDYDLEIKLSHLTKALYILFLLKPEGILFEDLAQHRRLLFYIYSKISNQGDLERLQTNIDNLLTDKDAYYVHLSRIKSEFYRKLQSYIADKYIIKSPKNKPKKIDLDRELVNFEELEYYFKP